jgi:hypothetical protein
MATPGGRVVADGEAGPVDREELGATAVGHHEARPAYAKVGRRQAKGRRCAHRQQIVFSDFFNARVRYAVLPLCPVMSRVFLGMPHINENG